MKTFGPRRPVSSLDPAEFRADRLAPNASGREAASRRGVFRPVVRLFRSISAIQATFHVGRPFSAVDSDRRIEDYLGCPRRVNSWL
jgi:hypothetical protein